MKETDSKVYDSLPKPEWLKIRFNPKNTVDVDNIIKDLNLNTVCQAANCPNMGECFKKNTATFMILGNNCTRNCRFCNIAPGKPEPIDELEPNHISKAVKLLNLKHVVITSVTRDDLEDHGATQFAKVIRAIKFASPETTIEVLIPDMMGDKAALDIVIKARPHIINHNMETIEEFYPRVKHQGDYKRSLGVLKYIKEKAPYIITKTGIMVGFGETKEQVLKLMDDVLETGCEILTIGQYLQPTKEHINVSEYVNPEIFNEYQQIAMKKGFRCVFSGPFVRSSYRAGDVFLCIDKDKKRISDLEHINPVKPSNAKKYTYIKIKNFIHTKNIDITRKVNCGMLIEDHIEHKFKILIDGIHRAPKYFNGVPPEEMERIVNGEDEYENMDYVLFSHPHPDHFTFELVVDFVNSNPDIDVIMPRDEYVENQFREYYGDIPKSVHFVEDGFKVYLDKKEKIEGLYPENPSFDDSGRKYVKFVKTQHMGLKFAADTSYALELIFPNEKILITADTTPIDPYLEGIKTGDFDRVFVNPVFLDDDGIDFLRKLNAPHNYIYHINDLNDDYLEYRKLAKKRAKVLQECGLKTKLFCKREDSLFS